MVCVVSGCAVAGAVARAGCSSSSIPAAPATDAGSDVTTATDASPDAAHVADAAPDVMDAGPPPSGLLDMDFNEAGVVLAENTSNPAGGTTDQARAVALDPHGNIVVAGWTNDSAGTGDESVAVWRYLPTGAKDTTFAGIGSWFMSKTSGPTDTLDLGTALCLDATGNVVVAGIAHDTTQPIDTALWRLTSTGELDSTFNLTGHVTGTGLSGGTNAAWDEAHGVACSAAGVVATGFTDTLAMPINAPEMSLSRFLTNGTLDTTGFASPKGELTAVNATGTETSPGDLGNALVIDAPGRIVVVGASTDASQNYNAALWRYTSAGAPDTTFNTTGHATFVGAASSTSLTGVAVGLDATQNIVFVATGSGGPDGSGISVLGRVTSAGAADTTFGTGGFVDLTAPPSHAFTGASVIASGVAIDSQGRIVVSGAIVVGTIVYATAWRVLPTGSLDTSFSGGGIFTTTGSAGGTVDGASGVAVDMFDRPVLVGSSEYANAGVRTAMAIWRLTP